MNNKVPDIADDGDQLGAELCDVCLLKGLEPRTLQSGIYSLPAPQFSVIVVIQPRLNNATKLKSEPTKPAAQRVSHINLHKPVAILMPSKLSPCVLRPRHKPHNFVQIH